MKSLSCWLLILLMCTTGCDPMRRITMINKSDQDAAIIWVIKEDSINKSPFYISNTDSVVIALKSIRPYHQAKMSFGSGPWSNAWLTNVVDDLKSMEIRSASGHIKIDSTEDIKKFLAIRRRGWDKSKIKIVVK